MPRCASCSASLPPGSTVCTYCGCATDVDLRGIHEYTVETPESQRLCPSCASPLQTINVSAGKKFLIERCEQCLGLFFDPGELEGILEETVTHAFSVDVKRLNALTNQQMRSQEEVRYRKCPVCGNLMNRVNFGAKSGVIIDTCRSHGVWLDAGELRRLFEWRKAGGKLYHEQVELEKKLRQEKEEALREQQRAKYRAQANAEDFSLQSPPSTDYDPVIFISKAIGKLLGL